MAVISPEFLCLVPGLFASEVDASVSALEPFLRLCFARELSIEDLYLMLGYNVTVPPFVRQALLTRAVDNDDLLPAIGTPVLLTHGVDDAVVKRAAVEQHQATTAHAQIHMVAKAGHAAFWDDAPSFNQRLRAFCDSL